MAKGPKRYSKVVWPGFTPRPLPANIAQIGRNDPCPCGSGKKYKHCHEREGLPYLKKLGRQQDKNRRRELRRELKERGVPWYRRIFV